MFHLLLENNLYVTYEQISDNEVEVIGAGINYAHSFHSLEEARKAAKSINERVDGDFALYSVDDVNVVAIMQEFSLV